MERRKFTGLLMSLTASGILAPIVGIATINDLTMMDESSHFESLLNNLPKGLPTNLPVNLQQMVKNTLKATYQSVNTDWDGTIQIEGLLRFANRGYTEGLDYSKNWFQYHLDHDSKLTDEEYYKQYDGPKARILRDGPLAFVIYSANLGVAFPVYEIYRQTHNQVAKRVCLDVADAILHDAARDRFGMLAHDDYNYMNFAIPDTAYWATRSNAIAASLSKDKGVAGVYLKQSVYQLSQGIKYFLNKESGLVHTGLFKGEPSKTYWCRSQGWLAWAITGLLRHIPSSHPAYKMATEALIMIAKSATKHQGKNGGLHVLVDDPTTPEEVTSIAMVIASVKEAMRAGWIPSDYNELCNKGWEFIKKSVDDKGMVHNAYTGWAVTAEENKTDIMDTVYRGFVPGILMLAADEMTK